jgi:hypothetical protein
MTDFRMTADGSRINYTCENNGFRTALSRGKTHGNTTTRGAVTGTPLLRNNNGDTLWLEYVTRTNNEEYLWLMWYDSTGKPTIAMSAIFEQDTLPEILKQLLRLAEVSTANDRG